jgi:hypothetical protein
MRGQTRCSPVLVQRAVSEDPRWTRAVGDHLARPHGRRQKNGGPCGEKRLPPLLSTGPLLPGVGFRCGPAWTGEDVVEPFQYLLA